MKTFSTNAALLFLLVCAMFASLLIGSAPLAPGAAIAALFGDGDPRWVWVVQEIRLPRVLLGVLVGASLGMAGAAAQGLLRNPLADPGIIGISTGAGLGAVVALYFGFAALTAFAVPAFAIASSLLAALVLVWLAGKDASVLSLVLAGVAVSSIAAALISLAINLSPNPISLSDIVFWLLGSLANRSMADITLVAPFMAAGWILLLTTKRSLSALSLGEDVAGSLGVNLRGVRLKTVFGAALAVGAGVAVSGIIGFVGLIAPHLMRPLVGYEPSRLLVPSALAGAALLVIADTMVRVLPGDTELKIGVVTSLLGAPFFLWLVIHTRRSML